MTNPTRLIGVRRTCRHGSQSIGWRVWAGPFMVARTGGWFEWYSSNGWSGSRDWALTLLGLTFSLTLAGVR